MATGPPSTSANPTQPPDQNPPPLVSWDGDRMFNIYILDYCRKRGYEKTANELALEADIPSDSQPPINAKQGLLFEWWSVFWVLFAAKSSGQASDDALLYTQHQAQQAAQRQNQTRIPQPPVNRFPNGIPRQGPAPQQAPMPNGAGPAHVQSANPMPNGAGPSTQPQLMANQRLAMPQQQRPPNGAPFSSPTMAHSPQTAGTAPGAQPPHPTGMAGGGIPSQPLTQMNRAAGMLPPNGPQPMGGAGPMPGAHQTPQPAIQSLGPSPNQPGSPSQPANRTAPSPSLAHRQVPLQQQQQQQQQQQLALEVSKDLARLDHNLLNQLKIEIGIGNKEDLSLTPEEKSRIVNLARQRGRLPPLQPPNQGVGPSGVNIPQVNQQQRPISMGGPQPLQPQPPQVGQQQRNVAKRSSTSPGEDHAQLPRNESSPPVNKRQRTSPPGGEHPQAVQQQQQQPTHPQPPMAPMMPFPPQGGPGGAPNGMMRGPVPPMPGFPQGGMPNMGNNPGMLSMGLPHSMPSPMNMMNPGPGMMNPPPQHLSQYRQSMQALHKGHLPAPGPMGMMGSANAASPSGADNQFANDGPQSRPGTGVPGQFSGPPPQNRLVPKQPMPTMMPPPASPGMNQQKNPQEIKAIPPQGDMGMQSPRNPPPGQPQNPGMSKPPTSVPGNHTAPPTPVPTNPMAPSPSPLMNNSMTSGMNPQPPPATPDFTFGSDIMGDSMGEAFGFPSEGMDFDRAFGDWFNDTT